jgi:hypothetical protein
MKSKNTLENGSVRHIIFKQDGVWYGVALEFNIVEEGDNPVEVMASLFEAIQGYVQTAQKCKMSAAPLNQTPDKEYQKLWEKLSKSQVAGNKNEKSLQVYNFGYTPFASYALCH